MAVDKFPAISFGHPDELGGRFIVTRLKGRIIIEHHHATGSDRKFALDWVELPDETASQIAKFIADCVKIGNNNCE